MSTPDDEAAGCGIARTIRVGATDLNVLVAGEGPDVLLLHGFPDDHQVWRKQIPALVRAGYRVIAPDLRGCGESTMPGARRDYAVANFVSDIAGILDALGTGKVRLVAHDWGAVIGWQVCMKHPERIDRYVAMSVGHPQAYARATLEQKLKGWYVLFFQIPCLPEWALRRRDWRLLRWLTRFDSETPNWVRRLEKPGRLTAAINWYRANLRFVFGRSWPRVRVPVFGIWSDGDAFLAESQMVASAALVDAPWRYARIEGANHWVQLDAPDRVNELLLDYLHGH